MEAAATVSVDQFDAASAALVDELLREFLAPPPRLTISEWAEQHRRLGSSESAEPGPYRVARTPYAREPQDCMSARSTVEEVILMWAAQTSKTTVMLNCIGASIGTNPGPMMIVWPTNTVAKRNSRQRIAPLINESQQLTRKVAANRSRDKANTTLLKEFDGGILVIAGANSAADLRSTPVRDLYLDEVDNFPMDVDGEGDPSKLAEARQTTFARKKRLRTSTPTTKDFSRIEEAYLGSDRSRYHVLCPHCGAFQPLEFGADKPHGLKWKKDDKGAPILASVRYVCRENGCEIKEHQKGAMLASGVWIAEDPGAQGGKVRGFHLNGLYSPLGWLSWRTIAAEWHQAMQAVSRGDLSLLRVFVNTRLAETFEEQGDKANVHELRKRAEDFPLRVVQWGMVVCTIGVDVQRDRLEVFLWAWGRGFESQLVDRHVIYGDPFIGEGEEGSPWNDLTEYRRRDIQHVGGQAVPMLACFVDAGDGYTTQPVYHYTRMHQREHVHAIKGASVAGKTILGKPTQQEVNWRGVKIKKGVKLWPIGTDTAKSVFYGRLRLTKPGPGYVHLTKQMPGEVFEQLTAERLVTRYIRGRPKLEWINPPGKRNEALDGAVYALAAAYYAGIDRWTDSDWRWREDALAPPAKGDATPTQPRLVQRSPLLGGHVSLDGMARFNGAEARKR
jgi:phage terminase large subunit GpA-like protein